jgi:hypothetical protein
MAAKQLKKNTITILSTRADAFAGHGYQRHPIVIAGEIEPGIPPYDSSRLEGVAWNVRESET